MAVFKVLSRTNNDVSSNADAEHYSDFVRFLSALAARFPGAKIVADMMDEPTHEIVRKSKKISVAQNDALHSLPSHHGLKSSEAARPKDVEEAEILSCVAKMVDLSLSVDYSATR
jgi:hypothetical protein